MPIKIRSWCCVLSLAAALPGKPLDPDDFQRMSRSAVNLLSVQRHYLEDFGAEKPRVWDVETGVWRPDPDPDEPSPSLGWNTGAMNFAFRIEREGRFEFALGGLSRTQPLVSRDSAGSAKFALQPGDSLVPWRTTSEKLDFFLALKIRGYAFSTLYSWGHTCDLLGFRKGIGWGEMEITPVFNYFRFQNRYQAGVEADGYPPLPYLTLGMEAYGDIRGAGDGRQAFGHGEAKAGLRIWPLAAPGPGAFRSLASWINLRGGYSTDALERGTWGHAAGITIEHLFHILHFRLEHSRNNPSTLYQLPVPGESLWLFDSKVAW